MTFRCYFEPCFSRETEIMPLLEQVGGVTLEFCQYSSNLRYSHSIFSSQQQENLISLKQKMESLNHRNRYHELEQNTISVPYSIFKVGRGPINIMGCEPEKIGNRLLFRYTNDEVKECIYQNMIDIMKSNDFTHFLCVRPCKNCDSDWNATVAEYLKQFNLSENVIKNASSKLHITIGLFSVQSDDELQKINGLVQEAIQEMDWGNDRILTFDRISHFGSEEKAKVLFIEPNGSFLNQLFLFSNKFAQKLQNNGKGYIEHPADATTFHITLLRPNNVKGRQLNARPFMEQFEQDKIPKIDVHKISLVQRFHFDPDGFYKTIFEYDI